jgi:hypothetical protein
MRRFCGPEAIEAMFERLLVEEDRDVRVVLLRNGGYSALGDRAFDVLTGILDSSRDGAERTYAAFELPTFGERAVEPLLAALKDPNGPRRAAAMSLGSVGSLRILPDLLRAIQDPANAHYDREIDSAIRSVCAVDGEPGAMPNPSEAARARIQTRIRALTPDSPHGYGSRLCRDDLNALPIHTAHLYLWSVRPAGTILCSDFDKFAIPTEEETDPVNRFAVMVHGAMLYPELADLIPNPPRLIYLCHCRGRGWLPEEGGTVECSFCRGMGWFHRPVDHAAAATS